MTDLKLYTQISELPDNLKEEVIDFINFLKYKSSKKDRHLKKRIAGKAKELIKMKDNFDDPIEGFNEYM